MYWLTFHFLSWHQLLESHILLFVEHSLSPSEVLRSKLALPKLSHISSVPVDHCTGQLQLFDCFASPVNIPLTHNRKAKHPACYTVEKSMENTSPNKENHYSVIIIFHWIYVVLTFHFLLRHCLLKSQILLFGQHPLSPSEILRSESVLQSLVGPQRTIWQMDPMDPEPSMFLLVLLPWFSRKQMLIISFRLVRFFCCLTLFLSSLQDVICDYSKFYGLS